MIRIELSNKLIQFQRSLPDLKQQGAAGTGAANPARPIDCRVVAFVPGAPSFKPSRSDLQAIYLNKYEGSTRYNRE